MQAVQFDGRTGQLQLNVVDIPKATGEDVLVKVAYSGVCGSDLHATKGGFPCRQTSPLTLGHEFCGVVHAVGEDVNNFKPGDKVAINPKRGCDKCRLCQDGKYQLCEMDQMDNSVGMWRNGGWADYCLISEKNVHKLPEGMPLKRACLMEPLSCIVHGWNLASPISLGSRVLILGAGIIGNLWAAALHHQGHRNVIVSEPQQGRRKALQKLDTGFEILTPEELKAKKDLRVDLVVDCSGYAPAMKEALHLLDCCGTMLMFGVAPPDATMSISPYEMFNKELRIMAVNRNPYTCNKALGWIESMGDRYINFEKLGIKTFKLNEYKAALEELRRGTIAKAMFVMDD